MAFWGVEVKPGKSFTHCCEKSKGRLRISQATLGIGDATQKGVVQCNVGNRRPVLLCALLPNKTESCHLDLEFEEADDVIFSVIGPRSVYLTGYYLQKNHQSNHESDTESYGVDIENTQTEGSSFCSDDDKYDDSFIDDVELQVSPSDPVLSLEVDANALKKDTPNDRKRLCKQLRKRNREILSDGDETHKTEDEHDHLLSVLKSRRCLQTAMSDGAENIAQVLVELGKKAEDGGNCGSKANEKVDPDISGKSERYLCREAMMGLDDKGWVKIEKNEGPNKVQTPEKIVDNYEKYLADDKVYESKGEVAIINQRLSMSNEKDCSQLLDFHNRKPKRKRRKHSFQEEKNCEFEIDSGQSVLRVKKGPEVESSIKLDIDSNFRVPSLELGTENGRESKERTEELQLKETSAEEIGGICDNTPKDNESNHGLLCDGSTSKILLTANGEHQEQVMDNQPKKKIKKKGKKKAQGDGGVDMNATKMKSNQENMVMKYEDQTENAKQVKETALLNGLIIEELAQGPPDGKLAAVGKKIKVFYTAMLKESGKVFDSNMNGTACSWRLGDEEFIDGWNIGIDGMRIGDNRRLVIPPSMGFGSQGVGENVPPNSWLVYDIELVDVR
ncbi:peptidyl-prolyl cis-trans isomerase FKBP43-like isoform X2 [Primulina eburnea]|uniref:peptidyl-prolyl cis-trans isomerase FKBP43-like isoform X2 n=1 Tax=Primulina eburnea TaxID=1245227 RepID=UPI003C6BF7EF